MPKFECGLCRHRTAIITFTPAGTAACPACQGIDVSAPLQVLRALGFLLRAKCATWPVGQLKAKAKALITHDRALRGEA
ncbi:hypothetical protein FBY06_11562 [Pseudomonas sp. SJZ085]|uniref:hypothetical protein n=1 Tax=unclassified Pseudomonas TaxID=196821 RepID=UPI00119BB101|nr:MULTISPECIES: hypothetical protein [unclassified Pseudomonas]TWC18137.1 hypothetical protein FBX99_11562 [Pseudomonas sp. SJZ074]TWC36109.1 hypothetical protein FBY06_11562 [Pseudomonas sp. SJZ085]